MKAIYHIKPEVTAEAAQMLLALELGEDFIAFGKFSKTSHELVEAAYFRSVSGEEDLLAVLLNHLPSINDRFQQVVISYAMPQVVMTPAKIYDYEKSETLIRVLYGEGGNLTVINESVSAWQLHTAYAVPASVRETVARRFINGQYWHRYSVALKTKPPGNDQLLLQFDAQSFTVLAFKDNQFLLAQTFPYTVPEDVLYALLKICTVHGLSQQTTEVILGGLAEEKSALYKELYKYFIHLNCAVPPEGFSLAEGFHEYPQHYFTSLLNLAACAS